MRGTLILISISIALVSALLLSPVRAEELTSGQTLRLQKYLPNTFAKLQKRAPVHVLCFGDSVSNFAVSGSDESGNTLLSYHSVFLQMVAERFFYTGGLRNIKPLRGQPGVLRRRVGPEVTLRNFTRNGATCHRAFEWLNTEAFLNDPDLAIVMYGINESYGRITLSTYSETLERIVQSCKLNNTEVILFSPSITGGDDRMKVARTRPYASVMKEVAEANGIMFIDSGEALTWSRNKRGAPTREQAWLQASRIINANFQYPAHFKDHIHPDKEGHEKLAEYAYNQAFNGSAPRPYTASGVFLQADVGTGSGPVFELTIFNSTEKPRAGICLPLSAGLNIGPEASADAIPYSLEAGKGVKFRIPYRRFGADFRDSLPVFKGTVRIPVILSDGEEFRLYDVAAAAVPFSIEWPTSRQLQVSGEFIVGCSIVNGSPGSLAGEYDAEWQGQKKTGKIFVAAEGRQTLDLAFSLPNGSEDMISGPIKLRMKIGDKTYLEQRNIMVARTIGMGRDIPLQPTVGDPLANGPTIQLKADKKYLTVTCEIPKAVEVIQSKTAASGVLTFRVDGRPEAGRNSLGFAGTVTVDIPFAGKDVAVRKLQPGVFGSGYDRRLDMKYVESSQRVRPGGGRTITVKIPRVYFYLHMWEIGSTDSTLGFNADLNLLRKSSAAPDGGFLPEGAFELFDCGLSAHNILSLNIVEMAKTPSGKWSVWIR